MYDLQFDLCKTCHNVNICYGKMNMLWHTTDELTKYNTCHHYFNQEEYLNENLESAKKLIKKGK